MDAPELLQRLVGKALCTQGDAIDAGSAIACEAAVLDRARIGLERDLDILGKLEPGSQLHQQPRQGLRREQAGCAAAEEHAGDLATLHGLTLRFEIPEQRRDVVGLGHLAVQGVRIEVAIRAFAHAPGEMHVQRQRRQHG